MIFKDYTHTCGLNGFYFLQINEEKLIKSISKQKQKEEEEENEHLSESYLTYSEEGYKKKFI